MRMNNHLMEVYKKTFQILKANHCMYYTVLLLPLDAAKITFG